MKLSDIANMKQYLENECYCPGEIYDVTGFFFRVFKDDMECFEICKNESITSVICDDQIINFWIENSKIINAQRYDATENNIAQIKSYILGVNDKVLLDEFRHGETKKSINGLLSFADAIIIS